IGDQTFIIALQLKVHFPLMVGRPMPVKNILSTSGVPIPFHFLPKLINLLRNSLFLFVSIFVIFPYCDQSLHEKGGLHQLAPIVVISKRLHSTCVTVQPMGPYAMKAICLRQKTDDLLKAIRTFLPGNPFPLYSGKKPKNTKSRTSSSNDVFIILGIDPVHMDSFPA